MIDFLVVMDDKDMAIYEKYQMIDLCKKYLENLLEIRVDLIDIKMAIPCNLEPKVFKEQ